MTNWETVDTQVVFSNNILDIKLEKIRTPSGLEGEWTVVEIGDGVAVLPVDEEGGIHLIRQYRHAVGKHVLELPAGRREPGEEPLDTARRELEEEAGLRAREMTPYMKLWPLDGVCRHRIWFFVAQGLVSVEPARETFEEIQVLRFTPERIREMILGDEIEDGLAMAALSRWLLDSPAGKGDGE